MDEERLSFILSVFEVSEERKKKPRGVSPNYTDQATAVFGDVSSNFSR
jgi:hypothetical protein